MTDDELFSVLSEIADEGIMAKNRASIVEVGQRIRRAALEEAIHVVQSYQVPVGNSAAGEMACEWTMDALGEVRSAIRALATKEQQ